MTAFFARAGEAVTTGDGKVICYVKNDLHRNMTCRVDDFHMFADGEEPWTANQPMDMRCFRFSMPGRHGPQICIEGEWRP